MTSPTDALAASIRDFEAGGYRVAEVRHAVCECGGSRFGLLFDDEVGVAVRVCSACGEEFAMLDSDEHVEEVESVDVAECTCGGREFLVAVGFAVADDDSVSRDLRWVSVGLSCVADGVAGVYTDWKIDYSPTEALFTTV